VAGAIKTGGQASGAAGHYEPSIRTPYIAHTLGLNDFQVANTSRCPREGGYRTTLGYVQAACKLLALLIKASMKWGSSYVALYSILPVEL
jgi:hypothetical protein